MAENDSVKVVLELKRPLADGIVTPECARRTFTNVGQDNRGGALRGRPDRHRSGVRRVFIFSAKGTATHGGSGTDHFPEAGAVLLPDDLTFGRPRVPNRALCSSSDTTV